MKRGEFSFVWLFAIIAGGAILFLAVYGVLKFGETKTFQSDTEIAKKIAILTDPMQAGFAEGSYGKIIFNKETKINNFCLPGNFGRAEISVSTKVNRKWSDVSGKAAVNNKYIFSEEENTGENFYVFSKPFNFPYKVADMIFLTTKDYCFVNSPDEVKEEIDGLRMGNVKTENCSKSAVDVCFGFGDECDVKVYGACTENCDSVYDEGTVEKDGKILKYSGDLIYAAIFSEKENYECNLERLMFRAGKLAEILSEKADLMNARDCGTNLKPDLIVWREIVANASASEIISLNLLSKDLDAKNNEECGLW